MKTATAHPVDLEPSTVGGHLYASRRRMATIDVASAVGLLLVLLFVLPSGLVVPQLTAIGRPALILGLGLGLIWIMSRLHPRLAMRGPQPIRWAIMVVAVATMLSYAGGLLRGLPQLEANSANRSLIQLMVFAGIALACADGIANRAALDAIIRVFVAGAAIMALIGILQSFLHFDLGAMAQIPGLEYHSPVSGFEGRGSIYGGQELYRVASTAAHYIEFSTMMALALPFGIHLIRFADTVPSRVAASVATVLIALALPLTISRTGIVALAVVMLPMLLVWPMKVRVAAALSGLLIAAVLTAAKPGLITTLTNLFTGWDTDPSIQGRTEDYSAIFGYVGERPWLGRGSGTFIPELYRFLDNQWLGTLVEEGVVGIAALAGMHLVAISILVIAYRHSTLEADRHLCAALISAQLLAVAVAFTFDSLAFSTFAASLALMTGLAGAMWRLTHRASQIRTAHPMPTP